jgi:hypothetical protein
MKQNDLKLLQEYARLWKERKELDKKLDTLKPQVVELFEKNGITHYNYVGLIWSYIKEKLVPEHTVKEYTSKATISVRQ